jgi:hypothetical protein
VVDDEVAVVMERELALLTPGVRSSADQFEELLDPHFEEIGKSGRLWTRGERIAALVDDTDPEQDSINVSDISGRTVGPGFVFRTYVAQVERRPARRSSLVRQSVKGWRVVHQQGTPIPVSDCLGPAPAGDRQPGGLPRVLQDSTSRIWTSGCGRLRPAVCGEYARKFSGEQAFLLVTALSPMDCKSIAKASKVRILHLPPRA